MKKKSIFGIIFTYILLTGCEFESYDGVCYYDLNIYAEDLSRDENGYYWMIFDINSNIQTFTQLTAETESDDIIQILTWNTDKKYMIEDTPTDLVNSTSYTNDGIGYIAFGVWNEFIGDTVTVYCGYEDECDNYYLDSLKIIVE